LHPQEEFLASVPPTTDKAGILPVAAPVSLFEFSFLAIVVVVGYAGIKSH
jgi:hypothetical protein